MIHGSPLSSFPQFAARAVLFLFVFLSAVASADKITLKDGRVYEGKILSENEKEVRIRTSRATLTVPRDQVERIEKGSSRLQDRDEKLEALTREHPEAYLDAAEWLLADGADVWEPDLFRRLCAIPVALDPKLALRANLLLGRGLDAHGRAEDAAEAWARAEAADPSNADAKHFAAVSRKTREDAARRRAEALRDALRSAANEDLARAVPAIRSASGGPGAKEAEDALGKPLLALATNLQRRIRCRPCDGTGEVECSLCHGKGVIECSACGGTGVKREAKIGKDVEGYARMVCRTCLGMGDVLCTNCKAERDVTYVTSWTVVNNSGGADRRAVGVTIHTTAGHEHEEIGKRIDTREFKSQTGQSIIACVVEAPKPGGKRACPTCAGVKFDPPPEPLDPRGLNAAADAVDARLTGNAPFVSDARPQYLYDADAIPDRDWLYKNGKWVSSK